MIQNSEQMEELVKQQIAMITDPIVCAALVSILVPPKAEYRIWYENAREPTLCWLVVEDKQENAGIVYSDTSFLPQIPWGLVNLSDNFMGIDSNWFETLERAFYDSWAAASLRIWNLICKGEDGKFYVVERDLNLGEAYEKRDSLGGRDHFVEPRESPFWSMTS
jgi:hypothetical protein